MLPSKRTLSFLLAMAVAGCGGSPSAPSPSSATVTLSGTVTEPGGAPVAGVRVASSPAPGVSGIGITDASGRYSLTRSVNSNNSYGFSASKDGYETRSLSVAAPAGGVVNLTIVPVLRIPAGDTAAFTMLPDEPGYRSNDPYDGPPDCTAPCRRIRVAAPTDRGGLVTVTVTARDSAAALQIFVDGRDGFERQICCQREQVFEASLLPTGELVFYVRFSYSPESARSVDIVTTFRAQ